MPKLTDKPSSRAREIAARMNRETILAQMPKIWYVRDDFHDGYRLGRTDQPGDAFIIVPRADFEILHRILSTNLNYPMLDFTDLDD